MRIAAVLLVASVCSTAPAREWSAAPAPVELEVTASVSPEPAVVGGLLTYSIVVANHGPGAAQDALMVVVPSEDTTFVSLEGPGTEPGWRCTTPAPGARGKVSCTSKSFASGGSVTFALTLRIDWCRGGADLTSATTVSSANPEADPGDNKATSTSTVVDDGACDDDDVCTIGDQCGPGSGFEENFDLVHEPALPPAWKATLVIGPLGGATWRTTASRFVTAPHAVWSPSASELRDSVLDSPEIRIVSDTSQLSFQNRYDLEEAFDGGVLEIGIEGGPFEDIVAAGGTFVTGGYTGLISTRFGSPIGGREAWTGRSGAFVPTLVNLPAALAGRTVAFRWRVASDLTLGWVGQWIDSVSLSGRDQCYAGTPTLCDDGLACTADTCDAVAGCVHATIPCDDGNACTDDTCDSGLQCVHANNTAACNDGNACTRTDRCTSGACVGSDAPLCGDEEVCTADSCDPAVGCVTRSANLDPTEFSLDRVDGRDLVIFAGAWNSCPTDERYTEAADLDRGEPCISPADFHLFMEAFGRACSP